MSKCVRGVRPPFNAVVLLFYHLCEWHDDDGDDLNFRAAIISFVIAHICVTHTHIHMGAASRHTSNVHGSVETAKKMTNILQIEYTLNARRTQSLYSENKKKRLKTYKNSFLSFYGFRNDAIA